MKMLATIFIAVLVGVGVGVILATYDARGAHARPRPP